jgi:hypothetical protein
VTEENDPAAGGMSPDQLLAEFEARLREVEAAGGEAPSELKRQLERVKQMMAAGQAEGIQGGSEIRPDGIFCSSGIGKR